MLTVLLVDDEQPARNRMKLLLEELDNHIEVIGEAANGKEAIMKVHELQPDLLFLDIQMPVLDGFDVADLLGEGRPPIIFITAYDDYALRAFEVHAVDYLLKPVRKQRLKKALDLLDDLTYRKQQDDSIRKLLNDFESVKRFEVQKLPVTYKNEVLLLDLDKINYIEADGKLTWIHIDDKRFRANFTLVELENRLSDYPFMRIHRSHLVNLNHVHKLEPWFKGGYRLELNNGTELDVARRRVSGLKEKLGIK